MATRDEIIADKTTYPDDTKITLASGVEMTLGELRGGFMRQNDYTRKTQDISRERESFAREKSDFEQQKVSAEAELTALASRTLDQLSRQRPAGAPEPTVDEVEAAIRRDPIANRLLEQNRRLEERLNGMAERDKTYETRLAEQDKRFYTDFYNRQIAALKSKDPELDTDALVTHAKQNGFRDLTKAYRDMTEDRRFEEATKKAREDGLKEGVERAKRDLQQPVIPQRRVVAPVPEGLPQNFDDAAEAAKRDPSILAIMSGESGG